MVNEDFHDKTEEPTPKRLADARKKGYVAKSNDLAISLLLLTTMLVFLFLGASMYDDLEELVVTILTNLNNQDFSLERISLGMSYGIKQLLWLFLPLFSSILFFGILFQALQTRFMISSFPLKPKWNKINIFNPENYRKNFGAPALVKMGFSLIRLNLVLIVSWSVTALYAREVFSIGKDTAPAIAILVGYVSIWVGIGCALSYIGVGIFDYLYQRWYFNRQMRMSRREIKDELKQTEGDLLVKNRIKSEMRSFSEVNYAELLEHADILITERARYVVALAYDFSRMGAPICLIKGAGKRGALMRSIAEKRGVPVVENPQLAQSLFQTLSVGDQIPPQYFNQVAETLAKI